MRSPRVSSLVALSMAGLVLIATSAVRGDENAAPLAGPRRAPASGGSALDLQDPSQTQLLGLLKAFKSVSLDARAKIDRDLELGPFDVDAGTQINLSAGLARQPGEAQTRLQRFDVSPSNPLKIGPVRLKSLSMDEQGVHLDADLSVFGLNFLPSRFTVAGGQRDQDGNLVLESGGTGIVGAVAPRLRITREGKLQFSGVRIPLIGVRILNKWRDVPGDFKVPPALTEFFARMPPTIEDLLALLPVMRTAGHGGGAPGGRAKKGQGGSPEEEGRKAD